MDSVVVPARPKERREYASDIQHLHATPTCAIERVRQDRLRKGWSATTLASKAGIKPKVVKYHEERLTPDDLLDTGYLKTVAVAMGFNEQHYLDDYLTWGDTKQYVHDINQYITASGQPLAKLYDQLGAQEYAVQSWRTGRKRPPKRIYELIAK